MASILRWRARGSLPPTSKALGNVDYERTRFKAYVTANDLPVEGAVVRLAGREALTNRRGNAKLTRKFKRPGRRRAKASKAGYRPTRKTIHVGRP